MRQSMALKTNKNEIQQKRDPSNTVENVSPVNKELKALLRTILLSHVQDINDAPSRAFSGSDLGDISFSECSDKVFIILCLDTSSWLLMCSK